MVRRNQHGVTLIELLLTLAILTTIGALIWSVFIQGTKYSNNAVTRNQMQQEANLITTYLTRIHQTSNEYTIETTNTQIKIISKLDSNITTQIYNNSQFIYEVTADKTEDINPNEDDVSCIVIISAKNNHKNKVTLSTLLSRLKNE